MREPGHANARPGSRVPSIGGRVNGNGGGVFAVVALVAATMGCCFVGAGAFVMLRMSDASRIGAVGPTPPSYAPVVPPPPLYPPPPSGPLLPPPPSAPVAMLGETNDTPVRGPADARITIHVVSEFQCPFCSRVEPTLAQVDAAYPGLIRWVWHDYPLPFHPDAMPAAEAAREVRRQLGDDAFWEFHDALFASQSDLGRRSLERLASRRAGIDMTQFRAALDGHTHEAEVRASVAVVDAMHGASGTPTFQIGSTWLVGAQPLSAFRAEIDRQLPR